jgi:[protein-PII] uridylyltransferase
MFLSTDLVRLRLRSDHALKGTRWCRAQSDGVDAWLQDLLPTAVADAADVPMALVAVGGYGRRELCPGSDLDVVLLHEPKADPVVVARVAQRLWYPIWDEGFHLGHNVSTVRQARALAAGTLDTATSLLSARHVAGSTALSEELARGAREDWHRRADRWLAALGASLDARHARVGEAAFQLEPDLKEAHGGLRDVHAVDWAQAARSIALDYDEGPLRAAEAVLLAARVELQRRTGGTGNVLLLQEQDAVAEALGAADADELMAQVADAARRIAWTSDQIWRRVAAALRGPSSRTGQRARPLLAGVDLCDDEVVLAPDADPTHDPTLALRVALAAAGQATVVGRHALAALAASAPTLPDPWPPGTGELLVRLLATGPPAIAVIEALDHDGVWARILPEWQAVRSRPQRNAYHRFTVDRHLLETVAAAAALSDRVDRGDLLLLAALLHDIGKGQAGDHSAVGRATARRLGERMGLAPGDVETLESLVGDHLLLAEVASRRDLGDPRTIEMVADRVETVARLRLLAALTEADSRATGPSAWSSWKAGLVATLVERVERVLTACPGRRHPAPPPGASGASEDGDVDGGDFHIETSGPLLRVRGAERPGVFGRVAGVLALHGLDVIAASASAGEGVSVAEFRVVDRRHQPVAWTKVVADLERALDGRLALAARLAERRRVYDRPDLGAGRPIATTVAFDNSASDGATVIDVHTRDRIGVLYRITRTLADLDLDIRSARVHTLGPEVVDSFYVRPARGAKVDDPVALAEIERAILHELAEAP